METKTINDREGLLEDIRQARKIVLCAHVSPDGDTLGSSLAMRLALEKIAALENLSATEEEIEAETNRIASAYNMSAEDVKNALPADAIAEDIKVKKAMDLVKEKAIVKSAAAG